MGMAASQARYLGLTARKTNVEYEGQQINQARTALANQSANLFNRMLALKTPTAPNKVDYTEQQYAFNDGVNDYEVDSLQRVDKEINGEKYNYLVKYHFNQDVYKGVQETNSNPQVQKINSFKTSEGTEKDVTVTKNNTENTYTVTDKDGKNATEFKKCDDKDLSALQELASRGIIKIDDIEKMYKNEDADGVTTFCKQDDLEAVKEKQTDDLKYAQTMVSDYSYKVGNSSAERYNPDDLIQQTALEQIRHDYPELKGVKDEDLWVYTKNGKTMFATEADLDASMATRSKLELPYKATPPFEKPITMQGDVPQQAYTQLEYIENNNARKDYQIASDIDYQISLKQYYAAHHEEKVETTEYARLDDASGSGRYQNIKLQSMDSNFALNSEEKTNEKNYENAMQQYNYDVLKYERELADINSKTSIIQVQDRTLELRLRQLDTEQKALSTEMESVKSVIQKNIETVFKTFQ